MDVCRLTAFYLYFLIKISAADDYVHYSDVDKYYKMHLDGKTWYRAMEMCKTENATLAMPENDKQALILSNIFKKHPPNVLRNVNWREYIFLAFHDLYEENQFVTFDNVPIQYYYHDWRASQPDNAGNNEDCGSLHRDNGINDLPCQHKCGFICQKNGNRKPIQLEDIYSSDPAYKCLPNTNKCYKLYLNPRSWGQARTDCLSDGGNLAMIENRQEALFLKEMLNDPNNKPYQRTNKHYAFVGFHELFDDFTFMTMYKKLMYGYMNKHWMSGNPARNNERCGALYKTGEFNDLDCNVPIQYFCERPKILEYRSHPNNSVKVA